AIAGYPHVTVPAGLCEGLPVGLSFFATAWDDAKLISYAFAFEQTRETPQPTI
ncbi:MAG TPA: amidase, partial [Candidatus Heimdallarchaeota archaeon]|nr:amidase [Candidatus Heimdallarchaeota archaeon]